MFLPWASRLPEDVQLIAVSLPGRGCRITEEPWPSLPRLVQRLSRELENGGDTPCYFMGHSFGGVLAFALALSLAELCPSFPLRGLVVSSCRPPQLGLPASGYLHELSREDFFGFMRRYNGLPDEVLARQELLAWVEPPLRADIKALELWVQSMQRKTACLEVPIVSVGGAHDAAVAPEDLAEWRRCTTGFHATHIVDGGHFYFRDNPELLVGVLRLVMEAANESTRTAALAG